MLQPAAATCAGRRGDSSSARSNPCARWRAQTLRQQAEARHELPDFRVGVDHCRRRPDERLAPGIRGSKSRSSVCSPVPLPLQAATAWPSTAPLARLITPSMRVKGNPRPGFCSEFWGRRLDIPACRAWIPWCRRIACTGRRAASCRSRAGQRGAAGDPEPQTSSDDSPRRSAIGVERRSGAGPLSRQDSRAVAQRFSRRL